MSNFAQDGFALLRADHVLEGLTALESITNTNKRVQKAAAAGENADGGMEVAEQGEPEEEEEGGGGEAAAANNLRKGKRKPGKARPKGAGGGGGKGKGRGNKGEKAQLQADY